MIIASETTASGNAFAHFPYQSAQPAPTLLLFAWSGVNTLALDPYRRIGQLLYARGWNVVSLDLPCHGDDRRPGEPEELAGWAARARQGEDFVAPFQRRVNELIAHLIDIGRADPARIVAAGTSRGGFMAFQAAMANSVIRAVAAFGPVTDLRALTEFAGQADNPLIQRLALERGALKLAGRAVWMAIGQTDERVDTRKAVAFAQALTEANQTQDRAGAITLRLMDTPGHASLPEWHDEAAEWVLRTVEANANTSPKE